MNNYFILAGLILAALFVVMYFKTICKALHLIAKSICNFLWHGSKTIFLYWFQNCWHYIANTQNYNEEEIAKAYKRFRDYHGYIDRETFRKLANIYYIYPSEEILCYRLFPNRTIAGQSYRITIIKIILLALVFFTPIFDIPTITIIWKILIIPCLVIYLSMIIQFLFLSYKTVKYPRPDFGTLKSSKEFEKRNYGKYEKVLYERKYREYEKVLNYNFSWMNSIFIALAAIFVYFASIKLIFIISLGLLLTAIFSEKAFNKRKSFKIIGKRISLVLVICSIFGLSALGIDRHVANEKLVEQARQDSIQEDQRRLQIVEVSIKLEQNRISDSTTADNNRAIAENNRIKDSIRIQTIKKKREAFEVFAKKNNFQKNLRIVKIIFEDGEDIPESATLSGSFEGTSSSSGVIIIPIASASASGKIKGSIQGKYEGRVYGKKNRYAIVTLSDNFTMVIDTKHAPGWRTAADGELVLQERTYSLKYEMDDVYNFIDKYTPLHKK